MKQPTARFGEVAVAMGLACRQDVSRALQMQDYRRDKGQEVPLLGALLERMGAMSTLQTMQVAQAMGGGRRPTAPARTKTSRAARRPGAQLKAQALEPSGRARAEFREPMLETGRTPGAAHKAPAMEPVRRPKIARGTDSIKGMLGWLGESQFAIADLRKVGAPAPAKPPAPQAPKKKASKATRARAAVRGAEVDHLRTEVRRLSAALRIAHARLQQSKEQTARMQAELDRVTEDMILKEDLIDALRDEIAEIRPRSTQLWGIERVA